MHPKLLKFHFKLKCFITGYIYANHISEFKVGICMALAGVTGIIGTFLFTLMAKRCGLERTGVFAFLAELSCLVLALASVWAPGSKFDFQAAFRNSEEQFSLSDIPSILSANSSYKTSSEFHVNISSTLEDDLLITSTPVTEMNSLPSPNISMVLLLVGIIMSRIGAYISS